VRCDEVVAVEEGEEPDLDIVERGDGAEVVEAALSHRLACEPAVRHERAQDERHRGGRVLLADVEEELALLGAELTAVAPITAREGPKRVEAAATVGVVPALERRHRDAAGDVRAGRPEALLRERVQRGAQLTAVQVLAGERAHDLAAKARDGLGVVLGRERWGLRK
jgi:hypothetical protein